MAIQYKILSPERFTDYELLDCGDGRKLERFGKIKLIRPEPNAQWPSQLHNSEWQSVAHAQFESKDGIKGKWNQIKEMPSTWRLGYKSPDQHLDFMLKLTSFKQIGVFPEQSVNWDYVCRASKSERGLKVLSLFANTGAYSMAAKNAGADVIHLESNKQLVSWARQNMELNKQSDIRWLIEDALKFVKREVKRGHKYNGIILNPPSFGVGPAGERFIIDEHLKLLIANAAKLLDNNYFVVCNSPGFKFSALSLQNMFMPHMPKGAKAEVGELATSFGQKRLLSHGMFFRATNLF